MADDADSKSVGGNTVWVQVPPPAPKRKSVLERGRIFVLYYSFFTIKNKIVPFDIFKKLLLKYEIYCDNINM